MSEITDWEPELNYLTFMSENTTEIDYAAQYHQQIRINCNLISENQKLIAERSALRAKFNDLIIKIKIDIGLELRSLEMILRAIRDSQSSHWQKKENLRLCLEILEHLPNLDRCNFLNYEDDF